MATEIFPVKELKVKTGVVFVILPDDETNEEEVELIAQAETILNNIVWEETESEISLEDLTTTENEDGDLFYMEAVNALEEAEHPWAEYFSVLNAVVVGDLAIINAAFSTDADDEDDEDAEEDEEGPAVSDESEFD